MCNTKVSPLVLSFSTSGFVVALGPTLLKSTLSLLVFSDLGLSVLRPSSLCSGRFSLFWRFSVLEVAFCSGGCFLFWRLFSVLEVVFRFGGCCLFSNFLVLEVRLCSGCCFLFWRLFFVLEVVFLFWRFFSVPEAILFHFPLEPSGKREAEMLSRKKEDCS